MRSIKEILKNKDAFAAFEIWLAIYKHILRGTTKRRGMAELVLLMYFAANEPVTMSMAKLAAVTGVTSYGNIGSAITKLRKLGLIKVIDGYPNTYNINWELVERMASELWGDGDEKIHH